MQGVPARKYVSVHTRRQCAELSRVVAPHGRPVSDSVDSLCHVQVIDIGEPLNEANGAAQSPGQQAHESLGGSITEKAIRGGKHPRHAVAHRSTASSSRAVLRSRRKPNPPAYRQRRGSSMHSASMSPPRITLRHRILSQPLIEESALRGCPGNVVTVRSMSSVSSQSWSLRMSVFNTSRVPLENAAEARQTRLCRKASPFPSGPHRRRKGD